MQAFCTLYNVNKEAPPMNTSTNSADKHKQQVQVQSRSREMAIWRGSRKNEHVTKVKIPWQLVSQQAHRVIASPDPTPTKK